MSSTSAAYAHSDDGLNHLLDASRSLIHFIAHGFSPGAGKETGDAASDALSDFEGYLAKKADLIAGFENQAQILLNTLSTETRSVSSIPDILAEEIKRVRNALTARPGHRRSMTATDAKAAMNG